MSETWLVALGAGRWQLSGIKAARAAGLSVLALDAAPGAPGFVLANRSVVVDISDDAAVLRAVRDTGIVPQGAVAFVTEAGMRSAAMLREAFGLPGSSREVALRLTDKGHQRRIWTDHGLPCPGWSCVENEADAGEAVAMLGGRLIVKPADSAGSRGITVIDPGNDWAPAVANARRASRSGRVIVETFIAGAEFAVETFARGGTCAVLAVSEKRKVPGTQDTVAIELATSDLPAAVIDGIGRLAVDALAALGHVDGPGHTEILRDASGALWLVEAAGRGGGFMVADGIVPRCSGYDLADACARQAVGWEPPMPDDGPRLAFVLRFVPSRPGIVASIGGVERARSLGAVACEALVEPGDEVGVATTDGARLAYILTWDESRAEAFALADRAEACLKVEIIEEGRRCAG